MFVKTLKKMRDDDDEEKYLDDKKRDEKWTRPPFFCVLFIDRESEKEWATRARSLVPYNFFLLLFTPIADDAGAPYSYFPISSDSFFFTPRWMDGWMNGWMGRPVSSSGATPEQSTAKHRAAHIFTIILDISFPCTYTQGSQSSFVFCLSLLFRLFNNTKKYLIFFGGESRDTYKTNALKAKKK